MFSAKVIADTISTYGKRITTLELTYPRFIHSEMLTHRDRARNSGSSRAIPWNTMVMNIRDNPVVPIKWGAEQSGMVTGGEIENTEAARRVWLKAKEYAMISAQALADLGVHKSLCNRLTEPFMWITVVMTSTCWRNFFRQRCDSAAEVHMQEIAYLMREALKNSDPRQRYHHLPYVEKDDEDTAIKGLIQLIPNDPLEVLMQVSTARCARVSYVQHGEKIKSLEKDLGLFKRLYEGGGGGHWSPFEHPAITCNGRSGPYIGWKGYRKCFLNECPEEGYPQ